GTAYGGQLAQPMDLTELRQALGEAQQKKLLQVKSVKLLQADQSEAKGEEGRSFEITYVDGSTRKVDLPNPATAEDVRVRASELPDYSIEQIRLSDPKFTQGEKSAFFTIRTSEKAPELVQASVDRLLGEKLKRIRLKTFTIAANNQSATLEFDDPAKPDEATYASPAQVRMLLERELHTKGLGEQANQFALEGRGEGDNGRFQKMELTFSKPVDPKNLDAALKAVQTEFAARPRPERLENFDSQLAADTQLRALYAILASWGAILIYLWFRFGSWTFGLAAVLCLMHDLFFTMGIIAFCHYIHDVPWLAYVLGIQDFKIDLPSVAALLTLVGYSVNDTIVVFDRIREVRGKNPLLTPEMINDSVNQTLSRTLLSSLTE